MSTIKKVALEAGVSTATVSRVLNGNYPVSKEALEKVMAAVKKTGYKGNAIAKSLKMNKTFMIGLVVPDISNDYFMEITKGIENVISEYGYALTICSTDENPEKEMKLLNALHNIRVDAVVLASCQENTDGLEELLKDGLKIVLVDSDLKLEKASFVGEKNLDNSRALVEACIAHGHTEMAIIKGAMSMVTAKERFKGYTDALEAHHIKDSLVLEGGYYSQLAYNSVMKMLNEGKRPSLVFATNNIMAEGAMKAINEYGLSIPGDISLVSYGNIGLADLITPKLTHVSQNARVLGNKSGELLIKMLEDKADGVERIILESRIVKGDSLKQL